MDLHLTDRVFLVTGGSTGLGRATAQALVREGARVVIVARRPDEVERAVEALGDRAIGFPGDLSDRDLPDAVVAAARQWGGRLDGALISVGGPPPGSVLTTTDDQWEQAFSSVLLGSIRIARAVVEGVRASGDMASAALAFVLSTSAVEVFPGLSTSNALRPGLAMVVKDLADEVGPEGMRVLGLLPGRIATDRLTSLDAATGDAHAARERASMTIPLRRYGRPDEFGAIAAFALSPMASYLTGSLIRIDGGSTRGL